MQLNVNHIQRFEVRTYKEACTGFWALWGHRQQPGLVRKLTFALLSIQVHVYIYPVPRCIHMALT